MVPLSRLTPKLLTYVVSPILILLLFLIQPTSATLSCDGEGQIFFNPEIIERETISIPCTLSSTIPLNASCVASVYFDNELISTYPEIIDVREFGRTEFVEILSDNKIESFVVNFANRDLLHFENFSWEIWCKESSGQFHIATGNMIVEYPFSEPVLDWSMNIFQRDSSILIGLFLMLIFLSILAIIIYKVVSNR